MPDTSSPTALPSDSAAASAPVDDAPALRRLHRPHIALAAAVAVAFGINALLAHAAPTPRVFLDELIYLDAADSLAHGEGLRVRGEPYGFAVLYPILLAPLLFAFDREVAYELAKSLNALLFAMAAVPVYFLSRRVLPPWPSVAVAALSIAIPSAMYTSVVMTESLAYLVSCWALLAILIALERPTLVRQGAALAAIAVACLARPQFLALYPAYVLAAVAVALFAGTGRRRTRERLLELWPTIAAGLVGLTAFVVRPFASGASISEWFGAYSAVWRWYSPLDVARYVLYELANLELYLGVVPIAVAPIVVAASVSAARNERQLHSAFVALLVSVSVCMLVLVAAVDSIHFRNVHDRYLFYVVPLWLIVLFVWLGATSPRRPAAALAIGAGLAVLPGLMPITELNTYRGNWRFHAVGSAFPSVLTDASGSPLGGRLALAAFGLLLAGGTFLLGRRAAPLVVAGLVGLFAINAAAAWSTALRPSQSKVFAGGVSDRKWVDEEVPAGASVTMIFVSCVGVAAADRLELTATSFALTEFFNSSIGRAVQLGGQHSESAGLDARGRVLLHEGERLEAEYVLAQAGVTVGGRRVAEGTSAGLALWHVDGPVGIAGVRSLEDLESAACRRSRY